MPRAHLAFVLLYVSAASAYRCVFCPPGKYKSVIANNACLMCPMNTYNRLSGKDDISACLACPTNTVTATAWGGVIRQDCVCKTGFRGPRGGPCFPCAAGTYGDQLDQAACKTCAAGSTSPPMSNRLANCSCVAGYTGPNGGVCEMCAANTYKTTTGSAECTACNGSTVTLGEGSASKDACVCSAGYTDGGVNLLAPHSPTACARFVSLTRKPSFASVATRNDMRGSAVLPTYDPAGGPNGNGHVSFDRTKSQYLDAGARALNIATNGGLTIVAIVRFTGPEGLLERIVDFGSGAPGQNVILMREGAYLDAVVWSADAKVINNAARVIESGSWLTLGFRYAASTGAHEMSANGEVVWTGVASAALADRTSLGTYVGKSWFGDPYFNGDMAGVFAVDEYMSTEAMTAIADGMMQGVDFTTRCSEGCLGCPAGTYKADPGPEACTNCAVHTYSTAVAAIAETTCGSCPANTVSELGSGGLAACKCNSGYTGADGNACTACGPGEYKDTTGSGACTPCGLGTYSEAPGMKTSATCVPCPANSSTRLLGSVGLEACECNAGFTGPNGGYCAPCAAGSYKMTAGAAECTLCAADTYSAEIGSATGASCLACPGRSESARGSGALAACICSAGYTGPGGLATDGVAACVACEAGTFKETNGSAACTACPANTYSEEAGAHTSFVCVGCSADAQSAAGSDARADCKCNPGYSGPDGDACVACVAGTFKTLPGPALCENCTADTFSATVGRQTSDCETCAPQSQAPAGSDEAEDCRCNAGYWGPDGGACAACGSGRYKPTVGSGNCSDCPANHYQPEIAQTALAACQYCGAESVSIPGNALQAACHCAPGYTGPSGGECTACYLGSYKPERGPQACTLCPSETYSSGLAQTSIATCAECPRWSLAAEGSSALTDCRCRPGYLAEDVGLPTARCAPCSTERCSQCPAGKYASAVDAAGNETCSLCATGFAADGRGQCDVCPRNSTAPPGSAVVEDCQCNPGYTGPAGGTCVFCPPGQFKPLFGAMNCTACPRDTFSPWTAVEFESDCENCLPNSEAEPGSDSRDDCKCSAGWTSRVAGADGEFCDACAAGTFKNVVGHAACELCPNNTYANVSGSTSVGACTPCYNFSYAPAGSDSQEACQCLGGYERFNDTVVSR